MEYLKWFHKQQLKEGYCRIDKPEKETRISKNNKIRYFYRVKTFPFASFNWIHDAFYPSQGLTNSTKIIPLDLLEIYLTPQALAVWIKDDGTICNNSIRLCTHSFSKEDVLKLGVFLKLKYNINTSLHRQNPLKEQYMLYIKQESFVLQKTIVQPYKHHSMLRKLHK